MFVYWGTKVCHRDLGWVGDFCPVCLSVECMYIVQRRSVSHVYGLSLGQDKLIAHEIRCRGCSCTFAAEQVGYACYAPRPTDDAPALAAETSPDSLDNISDRFAVEDRVASGTLNQDERLHLMAEPIAALEYMTAKRIGKGGIPTGAGIAIIALVFAIPVVIVSRTTSGTPAAVQLITAALVPLLLALIVVGYVRGHRSWVRRNLLPKLAPPLARLSPSTEDLETVLGALADRGFVIGKRIRAEALAAAIKARQEQPAAF
jgi:hypothetical protein